ncbi:uncharacterized protein LOC124158986 [Ischnura elegans]|uniref:uncharacterized protein LOC124158986 n=1 Tax=Ischnura elegans TaxID=197161 RepID=UPI001ED88428|nr:uncharacterized protein LOC124158986 [Ischnura elegans]
MLYFRTQGISFEAAANFSKSWRLSKMRGYRILLLATAIVYVTFVPVNSSSISTRKSTSSLLSGFQPISCSILGAVPILKEYCDNCPKSLPQSSDFTWSNCERHHCNLCCLALTIPTGSPKRGTCSESEDECICE